MLKNPVQEVDGQVEFEDTPNKPMLTAMLILGCIYFYTLSVKHEEFFITGHCWSVKHVNDLIHAAKWVDLGSLFGYANLSSFNMLHMGMTLYFFWVFGSHLEGRLGAGRYLLLLLLGMTMPWLVLQWDAQSIPTTAFFGGAFLCFCMIGGYLVVPPVPLKKFGSGNIAQKHVVRKKEHKHDMRAKWIANPWMFIGTFVGAQLLFHIWVTIGLRNPMTPATYLLEPLGSEFDTFRLLPAIIALGCGYMVAQMAVNSASKVYNEGPMVVSAIKRYRELLELDVKHDDALKGTARTLGLPYEKVRDMIKRNKGQMRIK